MKLEKILDLLNSFEKNSFLKVITNLIESAPGKSKEIEKIITNSDLDLKNIDHINISKVFFLLEDEFASYVQSELAHATSQLDILIDILIRDGNCIMSREWFCRLYEEEIKHLKLKIKTFEKDIEKEKSEISERRKRDYKIYKECLRTAYHNDRLNNQDCKVTREEQSILVSLSRNLGLSQEETKLINYLIITIELYNIDTVINDLKNLGLLFYCRKTSTVYVSDEIVRILRKIRGKEVADKHFRRVLRLLREPQINLVAKNHNIDRKEALENKIKAIIKEGIGFRDVFTDDIYKENVSLTEKKNFISNLVEKGLGLNHLRGATLEEKLNNLIMHFDQIDKDEKVGISVDGYEKLLVDFDAQLPGIKKIIKKEFELQEEDVLKSSYLLDYNIKPVDILDLIPDSDLKLFCENQDIKTRGNITANILDSYKDAENLYIENYNLIGYRNLNALKENGLKIKESDLGIKFEEITKSIFGKLGFNVDEKLRKTLNNTKNKVDIVLNLGKSELILVECKTIKESGYNKFSSVSRQIKAYIDQATKKEYRVIKSLLVTPEFSEEFEKDCREEFELNLSLVTAETLANILNGFKNTKLKQFPYKLLMKDVLIKDDWILKAINK